MSLEQWTELDDFFTNKLGGSDEVLEAALAASVAAGFPPIHVSAPQGKLLYLWARMIQARRILEIGTLGGYSAIWLGRALPPNGRLVTLEIDPRHADVARANVARAGLNGVVELRLGRAVDTLGQLEAEEAGPFDLFFIDADKPSNPDYFLWALRLSHPGSVIIVDNVVRKGAVMDAASTDEDVLGVRRMLDLIAAEPRVSATVIQTVGSKGHDGFVVAVVAGDQ